MLQRYLGVTSLPDFGGRVPCFVPDIILNFKF